MTLTHLSEAKLRTLLRRIIPDPFTPPDEWASKNIIFSDPGDPIQGNLDFSFSPFLRDVISAWDLRPDDGPREITVVAVEQTGKTLTWLAGLLYSMTVRPGLSLIYYTSDDKAKKINKHKLEPLMTKIPEFSELLRNPFSHTRDSYLLGDNTVYFGGVGSRVSSFTSPRVVMDEIDDWPESAKQDEVEDIRKRLRSYRQSILCKVCTVKGSSTHSRIWREFLLSSQGYFHLRCPNCNGLTMRSCDVRNLSFRSEEGEIIAESLRMVCPVCGSKHMEHEKQWMIKNGGYIHRFPDRVRTSPGFQWGALASLFPFGSWYNVARMQLKAGRSGLLRDQIIFDNSYRGLPYVVRKLDGDAAKILKSHSAPIPPNFHYRLFSADTQEDSFYWVVRAWDEHKNSWLLASGHAQSFSELEKAWSAKYAGKRCLYGIIDEGGHREADVRTFARKQGNILTYKGNNSISVRFKNSKEINCLLVVRESLFRLDLLYHIYEKKQPTGSYDWHLPPDPSADYLEQLLDYHPDEKKTEGKNYENFISSGNDHFFDAEKMILALNEYFLAKVWPRLVKTASAAGKLRLLIS